MQRNEMRLQAGQGAVLSAQVQHGLKMLQMSAVELEAEVARLVEVNPLLERPEIERPEAAAAMTAVHDGGAFSMSEPSSHPGDDGGMGSSDGLASDSAASASDGFGDGPTMGDAAAPDGAAASELGYGESGYGWGNGSGSRDDATDPLLMRAARLTLCEHLLEQVNVSALAPADAAVARLIVEALDDGGLLRDDWRELLAALAPDLADAEDDPLVHQFEESFRIGLRFVQSLDPAGVGARSVEERLRLQLERLPAETPGRTLAMRMVSEQMAAFSAHDINALVRTLDCSEADIGEANALVRSLAPRPAQEFGEAPDRYVVPEVIVREKEGRWVVALNPDASPQVRLNRAYANVVRGHRGWSHTPMGGQLSEARWLLRNLRQRADTIQRVAESIVAAQQGYFEHGDIAIRPLFLRDIAAETNLHESTISRVTAGKYMATPRGVIEFKHFFGSRLEAEDGYRVSSRSIQVLIRDIVAEEDPAMPLSDIRLTRALADRGVKVARRTVTKYRDAIGIPPVDARRLNALGGLPEGPTTPKGASHSAAVAA